MLNLKDYLLNKQALFFLRHYMKILQILIISLLFCTSIGAQTFLSTNISEPTNISLQSDYYSEVFNYAIIPDSSSVRPFCARNYQYKNLYFNFITPIEGETKITIRHNTVKDHGIELFTINNGEFNSLGCVQVIDSISEILLANDDISNQTIYGKIWINDENNQGRLNLNIENRSISISRAPSVAVLSATPEDLVQNILISGCVQASNITYTGHPESIGFFTDGTPGLDFNTGIILSTGAANKVAGPNNSPATCTNMQMPGDSLLTSIINRATYDAAILEFDFVPADNTISFQYAFGSEEYEEYVGGVFNDIFSFHVSGGPENYQNKNIALIPGTNTPVSINNVNQIQNSEYYYNNDHGQHLQFDGMTYTLTAFAEVTPCETYHIRLSIADAADPIFDSGVFLKAGSFSSGTIPLVKNYTENWVLVNTTYESCSNELVFTRSDNNNINSAVDFTIEISGSAEQDVDFSSITLNIEIPAGEESVSIPYQALEDGITEGAESITIRIYTGCSCGIEYFEETIYINDPIEITGNISTHEPICENDTVQINLELFDLPENYFITWSTGDTDTTVINAILTESGDVTAFVHYPCGIKSFSTYIEVLPSPDANIFTSSPVCDGDDILFSAENGIDYLWKGPEGFFTTESSFTIENAMPSQSGIYRVTVTGSNGCEFRESLDISIHEYPQPNLPQNIIACERDNVLVNPGTFYSYTWQGPQNWTSTLSELNISNITSTHSGTFYLTVSDDIGCESYAQTEMTINPSPVADIQTVPNICVGDDITLVGTGNGSPSWTGPNQFFSQNNNITIENINSEDQGIYHFYVQNTYGCQDSSLIDLIVIIPDAEIITEGTFCNNDQYLNLESINPYGLWYAPALIDSINGIMDLSLLSEGIYNVTYEIGFVGCYDSQTIQISIQEAPQITISAPESICTNSEDTFVEATPIGGLWFGETVISTTNGIIDSNLSSSNQTSITYVFTEGVCTSIDSVNINVFNGINAEISEIENVCITEDPIILHAAFPGGLWSGNGIINAYSGKFNPSTAGVGTHTIYHQISNFNCTSVDSIEITVDELISAEIGDDLYFCNNSSDISLVAQNLGGVWSGYGIINPSGLFSPSSTGIGSGNVYYEVSNGACVSKDTINITVSEYLPADFSSPAQVCLYDQNINLTAVNSGGFWSGNGITDSISGDFNPLDTGTGIQDIQYQLNNNGCISSQSAQIEILDAPNPEFMCDNVYCLGNYNATLSPITAGGNWSGSGITDNVNGLFNPSIAGLGSNQITYSVSNSNCTSTQSQNILVIDGSEEIALNNPDSVCINETQFNLNASPQGGYWVGNGVVDDSVFNPELAGEGVHQLTYNLGSGSCAIVDTFDIYVQNISPALILSETIFCNNSDSIELISNVPSGIWSGNTVFDNYFYPTLADTGINIIYYQYQSGYCSEQSQFELTNNYATPISISELDVSYCQNANTIYPIFTPQGGIASGISFSVDNSFNPENLTIGQQTITYTYTNNNACVSQTTESFEILEVPEVTVSGIDSNYCTNSSDVTFHAYPFGGSFDGIEVSGNWFSPALAGLGEHTFSYNYTAPNGCNSIYYQTVSITNEPEIFFEIIQLPTCFGDTNGIVEVHSTNNNIESVLWSDENNTTTETANDLSAGWYYVSVSNGNNCEVIDSVFITQPEPIEAHITGTSQVLCSDSNNALIDIVLNEDNIPYIFNWNDNPNINTQNRDHLSAGNYIVTIIDNNNCSLILNHTIEQANPIEYDVDTLSSNLCFGDNNASVEVITNTQNDCEIIWNDNNIDFLRTNLLSGTYYFTLTNSDDCQVTDSTVFFQPNPIEITAVTDSVICGIHQGGIIAGVTGGVAPLQYHWSNGEETSTNLNLPVGLYTISVTDANNCTVSQNVEIAASNNINAEITITNEITCYGVSGGTLEGSSLNGALPLHYFWNTNSHKNTINELSAGDYELTITDIWGCIGTAQTTLTNPDEVVISQNINNVLCNGDNTGEISIIANGGTGNLNYMWNNQTDGTLNQNLIADTYTLTITDENDCENIFNFIIEEPDIKLGYLLNPEAPTCYGDNNGKLSVTATGGTSPYVYRWESESYVTDAESINQLFAGNYSFIITDNVGCIISNTVNLSQPSEIEVSYLVSEPTCNGKQDGHIGIYPTGGTEPYHFVNKNTIYQNNDFNSLLPGEYSFIILDENNCKSEPLEIFVPESETECLSIPNAFTPNSDGINDAWEIQNIEMFPNSKVQVFNRWGQVVFETRSNDNVWDGKSSMGECATGTYIYIIDLYFGSESYTGTISLVR